MTEYDAVVYDLDGTLVHLDVDWDVVATDVLAVYERRDVPVPSRNLWDLLTHSDDVGLREPVEAVIAEHEREGAARSTRLPHADELLDRSIPIGVCSLNCESACRLALEEHGLADAVDAVIGRDSVAAMKPDPEPLLAAVRGLSAAPSRTLFLGDSERDEITAERAGIDFAYVGEDPAPY